MNEREYKQHRKKHCEKENTYDENCPYCNGEYPNYITQWEL